LTGIAANGKVDNIFISLWYENTDYYVRLPRYASGELTLPLNICICLGLDAFKENHKR
jgi:hypothetical protein